MCDGCETVLALLVAVFQARLMHLCKEWSGVGGSGPGIAEALGGYCMFLEMFHEGGMSPLWVEKWALRYNYAGLLLWVGVTV